MANGTTILRGWLVLNGLYIDIVSLYLLPVFAPAVAATWPWPNLGEVFGGAGADGAALSPDSFAARQIASAFLFHGIVRTAAGLVAPGSGSKALGWLAVASYLVELANFAVEVPRGTATDPLGLVLCPVFAYLCYACLVCADASTGAAADGKKRA